MINLSEHSKELIKFQKQVLYYIDREKKLKKIYDEANKLAAVVSQDDYEITEDLMSALFEFDGGTWETKKMFPEYKDTEGP